MAERYFYVMNRQFNWAQPRTACMQGCLFFGSFSEMNGIGAQAPNLGVQRILLDLKGVQLGAIEFELHLRSS